MAISCAYSGGRPSLNDGWVRAESLPARLGWLPSGAAGVGRLARDPYRLVAPVWADHSTGFIYSDNTIGLFSKFLDRFFCFPRTARSGCNYFAASAT